MEKSKQCENCGQWFNYDRITAKYCSNACKQQFYLRQKEQSFLDFLDPEDTEIESYSEPPINNITAIDPFEETITEPEVMNDSEEAQTSDFSINTSRFRHKKHSRKFHQKTEHEIAREKLLLFIGIKVGNSLLNTLLNKIEENLVKENPSQNSAQSQEPVTEEIIIETEKNIPNEISTAPQENSEYAEENVHQTLDEENNIVAIDDLTDTTIAQTPDESILASKQPDENPKSFVSWLRNLTYY